MDITVETGCFRGWEAGSEAKSGGGTGKIGKHGLIVPELTVAYSQTSCPIEVNWGLDKGNGALRMGLISTMQPCNHGRTEILARRDGVDYVRCLECDQVFEAEDLEAISIYEEDDQPAA